MTTSDIEAILRKAINNLFRNQPDLLEFTSESHISEWNLAHHLANEIHKFFPTFNCDIEIIKPNYHNMRPDIILHKRQSMSNFLVIEVKKNGHRSGIASDLEKISSEWFRKPLSYQFGSVVNIKNSALTSEAIVIPNQGYNLT